MSSRETSPDIPRIPLEQLHGAIEHHTSGRPNGFDNERNSPNKTEPDTVEQGKESVVSSLARPSYSESPHSLGQTNHNFNDTAESTSAAAVERANGSAAPLSLPRGSSATVASLRKTAGSTARAAPTTSSARLSSARGTASSLARGTPMSHRLTSGNTTTSSSATPMPDFTRFNFDVVKVLKEVVRRRGEVVQLRVLPKTHQLMQLVAQEQSARELAVLQERTARMQVEHKALQERAKMMEKRSALTAKAAMEAMKESQQAELAAKKEAVAAAAKEGDADVQERLKLVALLQPRMGVINAVVADLKKEDSDCALLGDLLEEDKKLVKGLKGDARYNKSRTAEVDGGAAPYWFKHCLAASFNVGAVLKSAPYRAAVEDTSSVATKVAVDKKMVVVRDDTGRVVAWAHTRCLPAPVTPAAEAFLAAPLEPTEFPKAATCCQGIVWCKDNFADVSRAAKQAKSDIADILPLSKSTLSYGEVVTHEFAMKDVVSIGEQVA